VVAVAQNQLEATPTRDGGWEFGLQWMLRPAYQLYERSLLHRISKNRVPRHVGIILDGNRRHARRNGVSSLAEMYRAGADRLDALLTWSSQLSIPALTLWVCSTDNLDRPFNEVEGILGAIETKLRGLAEDPRIRQHRVRVLAIGRLDLLPTSLREAIRLAQDATHAHDGLQLTIAVAYDGRQEITDAIRALLSEKATLGSSLDEVARMMTAEEIGRYLYLAGCPDPDLIIRTSGEIRMSGFLLWQSAYSEFYFCDVNWPAFRKVDFLRAIRSFQERKRRFGL